MPSSTRCTANLLSLGFSLFTSGFGCAVVFAVAPDMIKQFGYPDERVGTMSGLLIASYFIGAVLNVVWGRVSDSIGRRRVFLASQILAGAAFLGFGAAKSFGAAFACRLAAGAFNVRGVARAAVADVSRGDEGAASFNMGVFIFGWQMGNVASPIVAGILADVVIPLPHLNVRPFFLIGFVSCLLCLISFALIYFLYHDDDDDENDDDDDDDEDDKNQDDPSKSLLLPDKKSATPSPDNQSSAKNHNQLPDTVDRQCTDIPPLPTSLLLFLLLLLILLLALTTVLVKGVKEAATIWGGLNETHGGLGLPPWALGGAMGAGSITGPFAALFLVPWISSRIGDGNAAIVGAGFAALLTLLHPATKSIAFSAWSKMASLGAAFAIYRVAATAMWQGVAVVLNAICPESARGVVNGASETAIFIGCAVGPMLIGWTVSARYAPDGDASFDQYGFVFICLSIAHGVVGAALWPTKKMARKLEGRSPSEERACRSEEVACRSEEVPCRSEKEEERSRLLG